MEKEIDRIVKNYFARNKIKTLRKSRKAENQLREIIDICNDIRKPNQKTVEIKLDVYGYDEGEDLGTCITTYSLPLHYWLILFKEIPKNMGVKATATFLNKCYKISNKLNK